jgi:hypothetical protein
MSKVILNIFAAIAILGSVGAATVSSAEARCGFVNGQWNNCR